LGNSVKLKQQLSKRVSKLINSVIDLGSSSTL
jgi:hypothetical protein